MGLSESPLVTILLSLFRGVVSLMVRMVRLFGGSRYCRISRSLGESGAPVWGVVEPDSTGPGVTLIVSREEVPEGTAYL